MAKPIDLNIQIKVTAAEIEELSAIVSKALGTSLKSLRVGTSLSSLASGGYMTGTRSMHIGFGSVLRYPSTGDLVMIVGPRGDGRRTEAVALGIGRLSSGHMPGDMMSITTSSLTRWEPEA